MNTEDKRTIAGFLMEYYTPDQLGEHLNKYDFKKYLHDYNFNMQLLKKAKRKNDFSDYHDYIDNILYNWDCHH